MNSMSFKTETGSEVMNFQEKAEKIHCLQT